jgi:hypothetical protein
LKQLTVLAGKLMLDANKQKHSIAQLEINPQNLFNLPGKKEAGKMFIAVAAGPSMGILKTAVALANNPQ